MTLTYRGRPCCACQAAWLPVFEKELVDLGLIKKELTIAQLIGGAAASAGVHTDGGMADWWETDVEIAKVARQMGAPATWLRTTGSFANNRHTHSGLRGCPHMNASARAQITEVDAGGDGLLGDAPDDPRLKAFVNKRTWREGVAWATERQLHRQRLITIGTHNTLDGKADESGFADYILFTEAIPAQVRAALRKTHQIWVCSDQKDLVLAVHRRLKPKLLDQDYKKAHGGIPLVTPKRGTWRVDLELLGVEVRGVFDHRINAAFPPFVRGEKILRPRFWKKHTEITKTMIRNAKGRNIVVVYMGDPNTPKHIAAVGNVLQYEEGTGKDRIASNRKIHKFEELSKAGSDHHRLRGTVQL